MPVTYSHAWAVQDEVHWGTEVPINSQPIRSTCPCEVFETLSRPFPLHPHQLALCARLIWEYYIISHPSPGLIACNLSQHIMLHNTPKYDQVLLHKSRRFSCSAEKENAGARCTKIAKMLPQPKPWHCSPSMSNKGQDTLHLQQLAPELVLQVLQHLQKRVPANDADSSNAGCWSKVSLTNTSLGRHTNTAS